MSARQLLPSSVLLLMLCGCGLGAPQEKLPEPAPTIEEEAPHPCGPETEPQMLMIRWLQFEPAEGDVTRGVDIDGSVTQTGDETGCGRADFISPSGEEGIDNQFARVLPALGAVGGDAAIQGVFERTINSGNFLLMFDLRRLEDPANDECLEFHMWRAKGQPLVDAQGRIESGQTFDRDLESPTTHIYDATVEDGVYVAGPLSLNFPLVIDAFQLRLSINDAKIRFTRDEDGLVRGVIAGGVPLEDIQGILEEIGGAGGTVFDIVFRNVAKNADLAPDEEGICQQISVSLGFEAAPAYFFADAEPTPPPNPTLP